MQATEFEEKFRTILASNKAHPYLLWATNLAEVTQAFESCMQNEEHPEGDSAGAAAVVIEPAAATAGATERKARRVLRSDPELEPMQIP